VITALMIQEFRGLRDVRLAECGEVVMVTGPTGSGRTSLLEAVSALTRPGDGRQWRAAAEHRDRGAPIVATLASGLGDRGASLAGVVSGVSRRVLARMDPASSGRLEVRVGDSSVSVSLGSGGDLRGAAARPIRWVPSGRLSDVEAAARLGSKLASADRDDVAFALRLAFPEIRGVASGDSSETLLLDAEGTGHVSPTTLGAVATRATALAVSVASSRGGVVLVDDLDAALPRDRSRGAGAAEFLAELLRMAAARRAQLWLVVSRLESVDALLAAAEETGVSFSAHHLAAGGVRRHDVATLRRLRDGGMDVTT
jgi:energy-coupling factor transporter ATP-binding protein EcfA2